MTVEVELQDGEPGAVRKQGDAKLKRAAGRFGQLKENRPGMLAKSGAAVGQARLISLPIESCFACSDDELRFIAWDRVVDLSLASGRMDPLVEFGGGLIELPCPQYRGAGGSAGSRSSRPSGTRESRHGPRGGRHAVDL